MARTFPFLPEPFGLEPPLSILETLGAGPLGGATAPADGRGLADVVVTAIHSSPDFGGGNSAPGSLFESPETAEAAENAPGLRDGLVTFAFDPAPDVVGSSSVVQPADDLASRDDDVKVTVDFGNEASSAAVTAGESAAVDGAAAARPGLPGGGGGGGGGGGSGVLPEYKSGEGTTESYDIWIKFKGTGWTADLQQAFVNAADYLTMVITDDIGGGGRIGKVLVDDLYVTAEVKAIDGVGGILGQAGPQYVWTSNELTASGQMQFDVADASNYLGKGLWRDIVTHELMHVLGFGSLWNYGDDPLVSGNEYTGQYALDAYQDTDPGATFIPVEDDGGSGTAGSHWDEELLDNELMTGYINDDGNSETVSDNYLSEFSVMSLKDLGYAVTYQDYPHDLV